VDYYPNWLPFKVSLRLFEKLKKTLPLEQYYISMFGRDVAQPRLSSWHGDPEKSYTYSGLTVHPEPWTDELLLLRQKLEDFLGIKFNSVLANYYRDGQDSISAHSDDEYGLGPTLDNIVIASITLGEARNFTLRDKNTKVVTHLNPQFGLLVIG
jgi:alkylated DNA repair dioxygenase AlkB